MVIFLKRIQETCKNKIIIQRSEFITHLFRVDSMDDVNLRLEEIRKAYYDATHNCYAYILGSRQEIQKCSDDGEPQKTAGAPMLEVLKKNQLTSVLAVTTRYFGGILLGAGGLVRAYSASVSECLKSAQLYETKRQTKFCLTVSYAGYNALLRAISYIHIQEVSFTADVIITAAVDTPLYSNLEADLYKYKINFFAMKLLEETEVEIPVSSE